MSGERIRIGRNPSSDIVIADTRCSARHAVLFAISPDSFVVLDEDSSGGTCVNERPVSQAPVHLGDVLMIAGHRLTLLELVVQTEIPQTDMSALSSGTSLFSHRIDELGLALARAEAEVQKALSFLPAKAVDKQSETPWSRVLTRFERLRELHSRVKEDNLRMHALLESTSILHGQLDLRVRMAACVDLLLKCLHADCGCLIHRQGEKGNYTIPIRRGLTEIGADRFDHVNLDEETPSLRIIRHVLSTRQPLLVADALDDPRFSTAQSVVVQQILSAICVPLFTHEHLTGALYVDYRNPKHVAERKHHRSNLEFMEAFAMQASAALQNSRLTADLEAESLRRENLQRYLSPQVTEEILRRKTPIELGGRLIPATVLFSDIRGFTGLCEKNPPDQIVQQLDEYFSNMVEIVFQSDGMVDKFGGDSLLATFGAPVAIPDPEMQAVTTAIRMQRVMRQLDPYWTRKGRPVFRIGIGIHQGNVISGNVGSQRRMEFTVIGDAVNTASRVCGLAEPGQILVTPAVAEKVGAKVRMISLGTRRLKGKAEELEVLEVVWRKAKAGA